MCYLLSSQCGVVLAVRLSVRQSVSSYSTWKTGRTDIMSVAQHAPKQLHSCVPVGLNLKLCYIPRLVTLLISAACNGSFQACPSLAGYYWDAVRMSMSVIIETRRL
jgi:hypothetical protein